MQIWCKKQAKIKDFNNKQLQTNSITLGAWLPMHPPSQPQPQKQYSHVCDQHFVFVHWRWDARPRLSCPQQGNTFLISKEHQATSEIMVQALCLANQVILWYHRSSSEIHWSPNIFQPCWEDWWPPWKQIACGALQNNSASVWQPTTDHNGHYKWMSFQHTQILLNGQAKTSGVDAQRHKRVEHAFRFPLAFLPWAP